MVDGARLESVRRHWQTMLRVFSGLSQSSVLERDSHTRCRGPNWRSLTLKAEARPAVKQLCADWVARTATEAHDSSGNHCRETVAEPDQIESTRVIDRARADAPSC